jgi:two-component system, OmpR family, sensor histidine kinase QseC
MTTRPFDSLLARLIVGAIVAFALASTVFALAQFALVHYFSERLLRSSLTEQAIDVCEGLQAGPDGTLRVELPAALKFGYDAYVENFHYRVVDASGAQRLASSASAAHIATSARAGAHTDPAFFAYQLNERPMHAASVACPFRGQLLTVQAGRSDAFSQLAADAIAPATLETGLIMGGVSMLVFVLMAAWTARRALRPIEAVAREAQGVTPRNLQARLGEAAVPREVRPLVTSFNQVLERIEAGYAVQQRFLAAAAHELKTPLALMRSEIEIGAAQVAEGMRTQLLADIDDMARVVQQMLHLAEASEAQNYRFAAEHLPRVMDDVASYLARLAEQRGVRVRCTARTDTPDRKSDRGAVFALIKNLAENAILHSPAGGTVDIELSDDSLTVRDQGTGIKREDLPYVFERFWRTAASRQRGGAGLGLAICREIAQRHDWTLTAASAEGAGATFQVHFAGAASGTAKTEG